MLNNNKNRQQEMNYQDIKGDVNNQHKIPTHTHTEIKSESLLMTEEGTFPFEGGWVQ